MVWITADLTREGQARGNEIVADDGFTGIGKLPEVVLGQLLEAYLKPPLRHDLGPAIVSQAFGRTALEWHPIDFSERRGIIILHGSCGT